MDGTSAFCVLCQMCTDPDKQVLLDGPKMIKLSVFEQHKFEYYNTSTNHEERYVSINTNTPYLPSMPKNIFLHR